MTFSWVLFDADGVLQRLRDGWLEDLTSLTSEEFVLEFFRADGRAMAGDHDFAVSAKQLCDEFGIRADVDDVLEPSHRIDPDQAVLDEVRALQKRGLKCALGTNQQSERGTWMQENLPYPDLFDASFYSFELGVAKPDPEYFTSITRRLRVPAEQVFFLDDKQVNVEAARSIGMTAEVFPVDGGIEALRPLLTAHGLG